jgi:ABC-2 type transport system permease protein
MLLMGFFVPIHLFPSWLQDLCKLTPFPSIIQTPIDIYLGKIPLSQTVSVIGVQAVWIMLMSIVAFGLLRLGERRMVIQGG